MSTRSRTRAAEAARLTGELARALRAVESADACWGVWADSVRQDVEARHGVSYEPDDLPMLEDPEYGCALDVGKELGALREQLAALADRFRDAEVGKRS